MRKIMLTVLIIIVVIGLGLAGYIYVLPKLNSENRQIDAWISTNHLNKYGDAQNTAYSNGKPCNNTLACYDYIKKMHPAKPWTQ